MDNIMKTLKVDDITSLSYDILMGFIRNGYKLEELNKDYINYMNYMNYSNNFKLSGGTDKMKEIVSLNGRNFEILYNSLKERENVLSEVQNQCPTCGLNVDNNISSLTATGPATRVVGQILHIASTPSNGISPYTYTFWKIMDNAPAGTKPTVIGTAPSGASGSITYTLVAADTGPFRIGVDIADSCPTAPSINTESWGINVLASCGTPAANLTVT